MDFDNYKPVDSCQIPGLPGILAAVIGLVPNGFFVEVGAFDGKTYSNTWQLAELGWSGIYIEAQLENYDRCLGNHAKHKGIQVIRAFASSTVGIDVPIYSRGELTSGDEDFVKDFELGTAERETVHTVTLDYILISNHAPQGIDLVVIDVEGHEPDVLRGFDLNYWRPRLIIIEEHLHALDPRLSAHAGVIHARLGGAGYTRIYADRINSIYIRG